MSRQQKVKRLQQHKVGYAVMRDPLCLTREEEKRLSVNLKALERRIAKRCKVRKTKLWR